MTITNKMIAKGYLESEKDKIDKRKTIFKLTEKAENILPLFTKIWEIGKRVTFELLDQNIEIMEHLERLESSLYEASFGERIAEELKSEIWKNTTIKLYRNGQVTSVMEQKTINPTVGIIALQEKESNILF